VRRCRIVLASTLLAAVLAVPSATATGTWQPAGPVPTTSPKGWTPLWTDDFTGTQLRAGWFQYPKGWRDTSKVGAYNPDFTSVHDGVLDIWLASAGEPQVNALCPAFVGATSCPANVRYGRVSVKWWASPSLGGWYQFIQMFWPASNNKARDGEVDFPETQVGGKQTMSGYVHQTPGCGTQGIMPRFPFNTDEWHVTTIEWLPGHVRFIADNVLVYDYHSRCVPTTAMRWVLQTQTSLHLAGWVDPTVQGHVLIDWVAVWKPT
jgi:hypothetical protein